MSRDLSKNANDHGETLGVTQERGISLDIATNISTASFDPLALETAVAKTTRKTKKTETE